MLACLQLPARPLLKPPTALPPAKASTTDSGLLFREKLLYLKSLNIDTHKALDLNPSLRSAPLSSLLTLENTLADIGLSRSSIGRILDMFPVLLTSDPLPRINFLVHEASLPPPQLPISISRCPRLLVSPVDSQLRPALQFLTSLGFHIDSHTAVLLVNNVERTLIPKIEFLQSLGFEEEEVKRMVVRSPGLLTLSVENNIVPKVKYFLEEMKGELKELRQFPQYFSFSMENKIKPRHKTLKEHGIKMPLSKMLKVSDGEFSVRLLDIRLSRVEEAR